jgi:PAS domain S-box-containing protein
MSSSALSAPLDDRCKFELTVAKQFEAHAKAIHCRTDVMFAILMQLQWIGAIIAAGFVSPFTGIDQEASRVDMLVAVFAGGALAAIATSLSVLRPGKFYTRTAIGICQVLFSSLLIHLTNGQLGTPFHIFGSLAFLAAYRDWRVLLPPTVIVAMERFASGYWWPQIHNGLALPIEWRWLEVIGWVLFADIFLFIIIRQSVKEMYKLARHTVELEEARKLAEQSERHFRGSFDQAAVGMAHCSPSGEWRLVNEKLSEITGRSAEELLQFRFHDVFHPDDLNEILGQVKQLVAGNIPSFTCEKRCIHKRGSAVWVRLSFSIARRELGIPDYLIVVMEDISDARTAKDAVQASHDEIRKLSLVASKARHPVIITNAEGDIEWANEALIELTECYLGELINHKLWTMFHGARTDPAAIRMVEERIKSGQNVSAEVINYSKFGREYWVSLEVDPVFDEKGVLTNFIATQADITERKLYEEQLRSATEQAESANRAKSQFLANMSHEIRTPLNGILGFAEILLRTKSISEEDRLDYLRTIASSGKHLLMLINDVLDLSKIEAGQMQVECLAYSPHQIIAEVISVLRVHAQQKGIGLEYRWESGIPESIQTDPHRLKQLLMNLVGNAIKFTQQGSVMVIAKLVTEANGSILWIEVRDTGIGIATDKLATVFDPFVQADSSITRKHGGTGLGLAISRNFAEALGGRVWATSEIGVGSTFFVTVSTGDLSGVNILDRPPQATTGDIRKLNTEAVRLDGVKVLLVDDGDTNRRLIQILLTRHGANVVTAENGKIAVETAEKQQFDIVLMDMQMPVMDGYAATTKLRESGFNQPIIALTAHAMKGDHEKCEQAGCSGYLAKPIDVDALIRLISDKVEQSPAPNREFHIACTDQSFPSSAPIRSLLPTDDPELCSVVGEFIETLHLRLDEMQTASEKGELGRLAELAHWLKGAGGTVGFDCFTAPAGSLEQAAKSAEQNAIAASIRELQSLGNQVVV